MCEWLYVIICSELNIRDYKNIFIYPSINQVMAQRMSKRLQKEF